MKISLDKLEAIIFDFDGVVLDSVNIKTQAFADLYKPYGDDVVKKVVDYHVQHGGVSRFEKFRYYHENYLQKELSEEGLQDLCNQFNELVFKKVSAAEYISGAQEFLQAVSSKVNCYVCTGTPQQEIEQILKARDLAQYFKKVYGSPSKKKNIVAEILKNGSYEPANTLYFGDATTDYDAAIANDVPFIGIYSPEITFGEDVIVINDFNSIEIE